MTPSLLERRKKLVARNDAALERWPDRTQPEFVREMGAVAQLLKSLAEEADRAGTSVDTVERARTWRYVATAYFDLGRGSERAELERAVVAFGRAEKLLGSAREPVEAVKLAYWFGEALLRLAEATDMDIQLVQQARDCFAKAIPLALTHMPEGVAQLSTRQRDAEAVFNSLTKVKGIDGRIDHLKHKLAQFKAGAPEVDAQSQIKWLLSLQKILGKLGALDRRLQVDPESVTDAELLEAAAEVEELNPASAGASQSGPYDIFYRKYSALLHPHLETRGLGRGSPVSPVWDFGKAMNAMVSHFNETESQLETVTFAHDLMRVAQKLEAGGNVSDVEVQRLLDGMDEYADRVIDLALKHPKLPGQFADLRERLYQAVRRRASGSGL